MSQLIKLLRRDGIRFATLGALILLAHLARAQTSPGLKEAAAELSSGSGMRFLAPLLIWFADIFPKMGREGQVISVASWLILCAAGLGVFYAIWRLTRNSWVAFLSAAFACCHPAAITVLRLEAALPELCGFALAAWALAINAKPRVRDPRFPARPPTSQNPILSGIVVVGVLIAPGFWLVPLLLFLWDLTFFREEGRSPLERHYRGYWPLGAAALYGVIAQVTSGPNSEQWQALETAGALGSAAPWHIAPQLFLPGHEGSALVTTLFVLFFIASNALFALDLAVHLSRQRKTVPYLGVWGPWTCVCFVIAAPIGYAPFTGNMLYALLGTGLLLAILAWRFAMKFWPEETSHEPYRDSPPLPQAWPALQSQIALAPLPDLSNLAPAPNIEEWESAALRDPKGWVRLEVAQDKQDEAEKSRAENRALLEQVYEEMGLMQSVSTRVSGYDPYFHAQMIAPFVQDESQAALCFMGSQSPYAGAIASKVGRCDLFRVLEENEDFEADMALAVLEELNEWPYPRQDEIDVAAADYDAAFCFGVAEFLELSALRRLFRQVSLALKPGALFCFDTLSWQEDGDLGLSKTMVRELAQRAGFDLEFCEKHEARFDEVDADAGLPIRLWVRMRRRK